MYIDILNDRKNNVMRVSERVNGLREEKLYQTSYHFYYEDSSGPHKSMTNVKCSKLLASNYDLFKKEVENLKRSGRKTFESDIKAEYKTLEEHYKGCVLPDLHIAFFDIETDFDPVRGFSSVEEAFMPITAISVKLSWTGVTHTLVIKPKLLDKTEAANIIAKFSNTILCDSESQLLDMFLNLIEDADVISGWNSSAYDIPYIVHRINKIRGKQETSRLCLWKQLPKKRTFEQYGDELTTYDLIGRIHLDYLELYRKYTYHELPSYRLDYVGQIEVNERKVAYTGTLDELYNNDFEKFIAYSRQDTDLLSKIDEKNKFINLVNIIAHENLVTFHAVGGAVGLSDNAILLEIHNIGMVSVEKDRSDENLESTIAGAFVLDPKPGLYKNVAVVDITSLYPSAFRALNMSPETIIGYIQQDLTNALFEEKKNKFAQAKKRSLKEIGTAELWSGVFEIPEVTEIQHETDTLLTVCFYDGRKQQMTAAQVWEELIKNSWLISANGVIFRTDVQGVIPSLLTRWFKERKEYQKKLKEVSQLYDAETDPVKKKNLGIQKEYWDKRQYVVKINLNSVYGAITNAGSRYFDQRMGQSCTLTGRCITRHMGSKINELMTGEYKLGETISYGDTDSIFFTPEPIKQMLQDSGFELTKENFIEFANNIADTVNETFPEFLNKSFNVPLENGKVIKCGREICATSVLFNAKKRYACLYFDKENKRKDLDGKPGELKLMGIETQRSDTPVWVQDKLEEMIMMVLDKNDETETLSFIKKMRNEFEDLKPWEKGTPKRVNNMTHYFSIMQSGGKNNEGKTVTIPGHVRASINWNKMREMLRDYGVAKITDGQKIIVCKLKPNNYKINSIAIPIDQQQIPEWFKNLPFDEGMMTQAIIDKKVSNIIGVLNWDLAKTKEGEVLASQFEWD